MIIGRDLQGREPACCAIAPRSTLFDRHSLPAGQGCFLVAAKLPGFVQGADVSIRLSDQSIGIGCAHQPGRRGICREKPPLAVLEVEAIPESVDDGAELPVRSGHRPTIRLGPQKQTQGHRSKK